VKIKLFFITYVHSHRHDWLQAERPLPIHRSDQRYGVHCWHLSYSGYDYGSVGRVQHRRNRRVGEWGHTTRHERRRHRIHDAVVSCKTYHTLRFKKTQLKIMYIAKNTLNISRNWWISNISLLGNVSLLYWMSDIHIMSELTMNLWQNIPEISLRNLIF
jgi:hypothetical protein